MHVVHAVFVRNPGGVAQAYLDYTKALLEQGNKVTAITLPNFPESEKLKSLGVRILKVSPFGYYDVFTILRLRKMLKKLNPDVIITQGNRANYIIRKANKNLFPIIGVNHSYNVKRSIGMDGVIGLTDHMRDHIINSGQAVEKSFAVPNMIEISKENEGDLLSFRDPPVIGVMASFEKSKGVDILIEALGHLKKSDIKFRAVISGDGPEKENIEELIRKLDLKDEVALAGWVHVGEVNESGWSKESFYDAIDIFCVPSRSETFSIATLEAMLLGKTLVASKTPGPSSILEDGEEGLLFEIGDYKGLSSSLEKLINDQDYACSLREKAIKKVKKYDQRSVGKNLQQVVEKVVEDRRSSII